VALTSSKSGGRLVGVVRWRTQTTEFVFDVPLQYQFEAATLFIIAFPSFTV
jgi:hypothetical protein